ncbi:MAG: hypothetical protein ACI9F9_001128 [Candidatus Paceibacteria bacterium]|jgi:hypothetical protein
MTATTAIDASAIPNSKRHSKIREGLRASFIGCG